VDQEQNAARYKGGYGHWAYNTSALNGNTYNQYGKVR